MHTVVESHPTERRFSLAWCLGVIFLHFGISFLLFTYQLFAASAAFFDDGAGELFWRSALHIWSPPAMLFKKDTEGDGWMLLFGFVIGYTILIGIVAGYLVPYIGRRFRAWVQRRGRTKLPFPFELSRSARIVTAWTVILLEVIWCGWLYYSLRNFDDRRLNAPDWLKFQSWASDVRHASTFVVYEGLPHQFGEASLLATERATKKTFEVFGFSAYEQPLAITTQDAATLRRLATSSSSYGSWAGAKLCGGFHPDYFLAWKDGTDIHYLLLCFGCHEIVFYSAKRRFIVDLRHGPGEEFHAVLEKYWNQRPKRE
jgi:hypothetical protein